MFMVSDTGDDPRGKFIWEEFYIKKVVPVGRMKVEPRCDYLKLFQ